MSVTLRPVQVRLTALDVSFGSGSFSTSDAARLWARTLTAIVLVSVPCRHPRFRPLTSAATLLVLVLLQTVWFWFHASTLSSRSVPVPYLGPEPFGFGSISTSSNWIWFWSTGPQTFWFQGDPGPLDHPKIQFGFATNILS